MASKRAVPAKRGSRKGWVPLTTKVPGGIAKAVDREARRHRLNRAEYLYQLLHTLLVAAGPDLPALAPRDRSQ